MHAGFGVGTSFPSSIQTTPFGYGISPYAFGQQQWLQSIALQLNQLQQLAYVQHQQLQQVLQIVAQQQFSPSLHQGISPFSQPQAFAPFQGVSAHAVPFAGSGHVM
jgi:hypothetical protein